MVRTLTPFRTHSPTRFGNLHEEMENLLDFAFRGKSNENSWMPRMNVSETEASFKVTVELPGLQPEDVTVELEDGELSISGEFERETKAEGKSFHRLERRSGKFRRVLAVPESVDAEQIDADLENGVLTVLLRKAEKVKAQRIDVTTR